MVRYFTNLSLLIVIRWLQSDLELLDFGVMRRGW